MVSEIFVAIDLVDDFLEVVFVFLFGMHIEDDCAADQ
jgi:hypothetical protein